MHAGESIESLRQMFVINRHDVRGLTGLDAERGKEGRRRRWLQTTHHAIQISRGFVADLFACQSLAAQRRRAHRGDGLVVLDPDDGDIFRDAD